MRNPSMFDVQERDMEKKFIFLDFRLKSFRDSKPILLRRPHSVSQILLQKGSLNILDEANH